MTNPIKLEPSSIREHWDEIQPHLVLLKEQWPALCTWRVEDVYAEVISQNAVLYHTEDGFAVCALETDEYTNDSDLFIWIAVSYGAGSIMKKYLPSFIEVARHLGCKGVSTVSDHPALASVLTPIYTKYRVVVDGEDTKEAGTDS